MAGSESDSGVFSAEKSIPPSSPLSYNSFSVRNLGGLNGDKVSFDTAICWGLTVGDADLYSYLILLSRQGKVVRGSSPTWLLKRD